MAMAVGAVVGCSNEGADTSVDQTTDETNSTHNVTNVLTIPPTGPTVDETILPPPEGLDQLAAGLLGTEQLGVPDTWAGLDFDPLMLDDPEIVGDVDPFRGLVVCPTGAVRDAENPWIARKVSAIDAPLDNGLLTVELILELKSAESHAEQMVDVAACAPAPDATLASTEPTVELAEIPPRPIAATGFQVVAEPTDAVPFPYAIEALWVHDGRFTVGVVLGGEPEDPTDPTTRTGWTEAAEEIAAQALAALLDGP